jgi:hypothetical protein
MKIFLKIKLILFFTTVFYALYGQDSHYWSENYGNKSMLLSGTVNASVSDLGAVFYNPGRIGLIDNPAFAINAEVYKLNYIKIEDGVNEGSDLKKKTFGGAPSLAAGSFNLPFLKNHRFVYSFLTRQSTNTDFFIRVEKKGDVVEAIPGEELFNGKLDFNSSFKDEWIGLTWAPPVSENIGIGLSNFVSVLNKNSFIGLDMHTLDERNKVAELLMNRKYSFNTYGLLWKFGMAWKSNVLNLGLTVTTPRINVINSGSVLFEEYLINVDVTGDGETDDNYKFNTQNDLESAFHTPWAVGLGAGIQLKKGVIHLSTEWYSKVPEYTLLKTNPFEVQSTGEILEFQVVNELKSVFNFGIGVEWLLNEKISAYASFATDFSAATSGFTDFAEFDTQASNSNLQADFYQFGGGVSIETRIIEITLGATYRGATDEIDRPINFPDEDDIPVFNNNEKSSLYIKQWSFILGFTFLNFESILDKSNKN